jgi:citrate lyase subunit beta / citryl-CoA lyase
MLDAPATLSHPSRTIAGMSARSRNLPRRSCHAVPGSSERFIAKAPSLPADMFFLDLEDAVAPSEKEASRARVAAAVRDQDWGEAVVAVRVNAWDTRWTYGDVIEVVAAAGERLDVVVLPKVNTPAEVAALDFLLRQVEANCGLPAGHIGIEAQIESAQGLVNVEAICAASPRLEAVILGPLDLSASMGMPSQAGGMLIPDYPGDYFHYVFVKILMAGRANGLQVIDGPYVKIRDPDGLVETARRTQILGYDGKWSVHPDQIAPINELFSPTQEQFNRAVAILSAYEASVEGSERKGSLMLGEEMIDEASAKMARSLVTRGRRSGLSPKSPS